MLFRSDGSGTGDGSGSGDGSGGDSTDSEPETELRATMLVLTANTGGVFLNKLFYIKEEELQDDDS